ncbi:glycine--tRNA ligase subunit beta [Pelagibius sp.]|uniref:glycine--tRNA ligase subunit beta n=1 Tax=Pelagibius sp. TaxID=1931238 RepID=UPI002614ECBD|nr:glycine--tRNA ligase subunit beta [Pelagibius sp.]
MAELLVELFSEEIPARMQARAAEDLKRLVIQGLKEANLAFESAAAYATPRRLALVVEGLPQQQPDLSEEKKGPKVGAPEQALNGFMKANGLDSIDQAEVRETPKGNFYFAVRHAAGRSSAEVLPEVLSKAFGDLPWPKSMRWGSDSRRWVRPLHGILAVFDGQGLTGTFEMSPDREIVFGIFTQGHRFLAKQVIDGGGIGDQLERTHLRRDGGDVRIFTESVDLKTITPESLKVSFTVNCFEDYRNKLRITKVMLDPAERRSIIVKQCQELAGAEGVSLKDDPGLLDEVTGLVEWPQVLMGRIDKGFMDLPAEVLSTTMRSHQKYFSTENADGGLAERFLLVSNMDAPPGGDLAKTIVAGNERVLRARLADARFFWDQDRQQPLSARVPALEEIVFHAKLGTVAEKVSRLQSLAVAISAHVPSADRDQVRSAARLCKADLVTGMVGEFPELQGIMGRYYALNDGEAPAVAEAVAEHYAPLGPNDACPSAPVSVCVALADKIDTLVGFWAIDEKPTGSKDPYALRRAALGVIRLIVENKLRLPLARIFATAQAEYPRLAATSVVDDLLDFFGERLKVVLRDQGVRHDLIASVFAATKREQADLNGGSGEVDLVRLLGRVSALDQFLDTEDGSSLLIAFRRAANIVRIEEKKDKAVFDGGASPARFQQQEEEALYFALGTMVKETKACIDEERFVEAMTAMARLRQPVDAFFDEVTVNVDDAELRENRLRLLKQIDHSFADVADFSKIEG